MKTIRAKKVSCPYCAQTDTKKDSYGYCIKYACLIVSGVDTKINDFAKRALSIATMPNEYVSLNIISYVTNYYNLKERKADDLRAKCLKELGFIPGIVSDRLRNCKRWDRNIRW